MIAVPNRPERRAGAQRIASVHLLKRNAIWNNCIIAVICLVGLLSLSLSFYTTDSFSVLILTDNLLSEYDSDDNTDENDHRIDGSVAASGIPQLNTSTPTCLLYFSPYISFQTTRYLSLSAGRSPPFLS